MLLPPAETSDRWTGGEAYQSAANAHQIPARRAQIDMPAVKVRARVVWSADGEEHVDGSSDAYCGRLALVHT